MGAILVQVERCRQGKPHKRCKWEWVHVSKGEALNRRQEEDMEAFERFLQENLSTQYVVR